MFQFFLLVFRVLDSEGRSYLSVRLASDLWPPQKPKKATGTPPADAHDARRGQPSPQNAHHRLF